MAITPGCVFWFTGLSGTGKSTLALKLAHHFHTHHTPHQLLDGDALRAALSPRLGFTKEDRDEHIQRIGFIAHMLSTHGIHSIVAAISPYQEARNAVRNKVHTFVEIHCHAPLETLIARDPKGLYKRALNNEIPHFTGISDPYEPPTNPELSLNTHIHNPEVCFQQILNLIEDLPNIPT